tara:strand:- start:485 stop:1330 length:846 start_codon:yes stop_codon:yes gene_type:complete
MSLLPNKAELLGLGRNMSRPLIVCLGLLPFIFLIAAYYFGSEARLSENPSDKVMPAFTSMFDAFYRYAFEADKRTGEYLLFNDWLSSMKRLGSGIGLAALTALVLGIAMGLFPIVKRSFLPFITFCSIVPPLAILPILFIIFGVNETGKIALIFLGTVWFISRDIYEYVGSIPKEQIVKTLTFNSSIFGLLYRVILPQIMPRLIDAVRLSLGAAWLFLIAAEAIASTDGLGYRIFLVRRYLAMDVIIPYVAVITLTGFVLDSLLRKANVVFYPWYVAKKRM